MDTTIGTLEVWLAHMRAKRERAKRKYEKLNANVEALEITIKHLQNPMPDDIEDEDDE